MSPRRRYAPIERARRLLLVVLAIAVVVVVVIFMRREPVTVEAPPTDQALLGESPEADVVMAGESFEYEHTDGERRVFRIQAARLVSDREGRFALEDVRLDVERDQGRPYVIESDRALYRLEESEAELRGNVRVYDDQGLELETDALQLVRNGSAVESSSAVDFRLGNGFAGRADRLVYHLQRERLRLSGKVRIDNRAAPGARASLRCEEVELERSERLLRAEGEVRLSLGESMLRARRLSLTYAADESTLESARAFWEVRGSLRRDYGGDFGVTARLTGHQLTMLFDGQGRYRQAELEGGRGAPAEIEVMDDSRLGRRVEAPYLTADFRAGAIDLVRGFDGVVIEERLNVGRAMPLRTVCALWAFAEFNSAGEVAAMVVQRDVDYREAGLQALGERVEVAGDEAVFTGDLALLLTDRGELRAPRIEWSGGSGSARAEGGVRAEFPEEGSFALIAEGSSEPIRLTSRRASWTGEPVEFAFYGQVRAWQGENYLLADRLEGNEGGEELRAKGKVKTVLRPVEEPQETSADEAPAERRSPIEVTADALAYRRLERRLTYTGNVRAHEAGRTMRCADMEALLGEDDRFERLICRDDLVLENPAGGHTLRGDLAVYQPATGVVEVAGAPVVMTNRDGAELRGPIILYNVDTGAAQVKTVPSTVPGDGPEAPG